MLTEFVKVASKNDLADNSMMSVTVGKDEFVLARVEGEYFALAGWCSHENGLLAEGQLHADTCEVECPVHEAYFDLKTGNATALPADRPVLTYPVKVEGDDILIGPQH
jgi:3-phenylpropionate/trans-cinnamate dioxygenase ferredoxin subunit